MWRLALGVRGLVVCGGLLLGAASIAAHHSFDAEFDRNKPVTVTGVVTQVDWFNPTRTCSWTSRTSRGRS